MHLKKYFKKAIKAITPYGILVFYWHKKEKKAIRKLNGPENYCPICNKKSYFKSFGLKPRQKAQCLHCRSLERHRLMWLFLKKKTRLFKTQKLLHIAAEPCFEIEFKKLLGANYLTADLNNPKAMVKMDITDIQYPDDSFDMIICNHVLEHVPDDIKAMKEFYRVLKKTGWAILNVPIRNTDKTYEDFSITSKEERTKEFGQWDHVRYYGRDYLDRLKSVGFNVINVKRDELASNNKIKKMNLGMEMFYCTK